MSEHKVQQAIDRHGPDSLEAAGAQFRFASWLHIYGKYGESLAMYDKALRTFKAKLGPEHPDVTSTKICIGKIREKQGKYEEAMQVLNEAARSLVFP